MKIKTFTSNFYHLILSRSTRNIADSFYLIAFSIGLVQVYQIDAAKLSLFTLLGLLPNVTSIFYGPFLNRIKNDKKWLMIFQISQLVVIVGIILCLNYQFAVLWMYSLNFIFNLLTTLLNTMQMKITPETLDNDSELIDKSVDIQYKTSNVLDIISNFIASSLLAFISYLVLLQLSIPFFIGAIYFMFRVKLDTRATSQFSKEHEKEKLRLLESVEAFRESKFASLIIFIEAFLSGGTDLLLTLVPLYLLQEKIPIGYLGVVLAVQRGADLLGALLAPRIRIRPRHFFCIDYIISGLCLLFVFIIPYPLVKLLLFFIAFVVIGVSGNIFEKMIYAEYDNNKVALIYTASSSLYAIFGILFLLIPSFYQNITVLGISINIMTFGIGVYLLIKSGVLVKGELS